MPTVVHCVDSSTAKAERERSYDAHMAHLRTVMRRICFAGPLATTDDARVKGDENLVGSLFVIDEPPTVAFELIRRDPYVTSGVWGRLSVFQTVNEFGPWCTGVPRSPTGRLYAALASFPASPVAFGEAVLFGAELQIRHSHGPPDAAQWNAVGIFSANSLEEARAMLEKYADDRWSKIESWALPIAVGNWTVPNPAIL